MSSKITKIIIGIVAIVGLGGAVYFIFFTEPPVVSPDVLIPAEGESVGQDILTLVDKFNSISIDSSIFSSTLFTNLIDSSVPLIPEAQGRPNPFSIIGVDTGSFANTLAGSRSTVSP